MLRPLDLAYTVTEAFKQYNYTELDDIYYRGRMSRRWTLDTLFNDISRIFGPVQRLQPKPPRNAFKEVQLASFLRHQIAGPLVTIENPATLQFQLSCQLTGAQKNWLQAELNIGVYDTLINQLNTRLVEQLQKELSPNARS